MSADAKCKVPVGEPDFPIALVNHDKRVIIGNSKTFMVSDHDFTKLSLLLDTYLLHELPELDNSEGSSKVGEWYTGQVYYGLKCMVIQGSSAMHCTVELSEVMTLHFEKLSAHVYAYIDGGPEHKVDNSSVQKLYISLFLKHDFDEILIFLTGIQLKVAIQ